MEEAYYKTKRSVEEYIHLAKDVNGKVLIEKLKKILALNSTLLEIGSGPGTDWGILNNFYNVTGSDNSVEFLKYLMAENPEGNFLELEAKTLSTNKKFDGVYSNKVLHHLNDNDLIASINRQYELLNPNGVICHSFWKGDGSEIFKGLFVNYHNEEGLKKLFKAKFKVLSVESYKEFDNGDSLLLMGRKK